MKILIIVHNLTGGGAERVAAMWANGFIEAGNNVTLVLSDNKSPVTYDVSTEVGFEYMCSYAKYGIIRRIDRIIKLRKILLRRKPDFIIGIMFLNSLNAFFASIGLNIPIVHTEHNSFERPSYAPMKLADKVGKFILNGILYDHITVLTQTDKDIVGSRFKNITILPNPLALTPAKKLPSKQKIILAVGRLDAWHCKGFDILIQAWARIVDKAEGWQLQIAGDSKTGGYKFLQNLCRECSVSDSVKLLGYQENILPLYQNASIFVLSSRYEGFGLVLIEAMSQGCACVACDYKGRQSEIITSEQQGLTCEPDNVEELSRAILCLIQNDNKRIEIGKNAIIRSHDYTIDNIMNIWDYILENI